MRVYRASNIADIRQEDWDDLLRRSGNKSIFMTWIWLKTWWEVFGQDHELWWLNVTDDCGKLIGSAPFYLRRQRNGLILPHRELRFIGTGAPVSPEHLDILADPVLSNEVFQAIGQYLNDHHKDWDVLLLTDLTHGRDLIAPATLKLADILSKHNPSVCIEGQSPLAPYVPLPGTWEEYFKSLGKWLRGTIARQRSKQTREMNMSFNLWSAQDGGFDLAFSKFEKLYALRKESVKVKNKFDHSNGYRQFHRLLASRFAEQGWLNLAFLKIGDREVACEYTFKYLDTLYSYQCGFDPEFGKNNVFKVLRSYVIQDAIQQGIKEIGFLPGERAYKNNWKAVPRKKQMIRCFSSTFYGRTLDKILKLRRQGKRLLRQAEAVNTHES